MVKREERKGGCGGGGRGGRACNRLAALESLAAALGRCRRGGGLQPAVVKAAPRHGAAQAAVLAFGEQIRKRLTKEGIDTPDLSVDEA